jgi:hypothetical protein
VPDAEMDFFVNPATHAITCTQAGVTFHGAVNTSGVVQGMTANRWNKIKFKALSTTLIWVSVEVSQNTNL